MKKFISIFFLFAAFLACNNKQPKVLSVSIETSFQNDLLLTDWLDFQIYNANDSAKVSYKDPAGLILYNTESAKLEDTIALDELGFNSIDNYHLLNSETFLVQSDTLFLICINGKRSLVSVDLPKNVISTKHGVLAFFPDHEKFIFQIIDYRNSGDSSFDYDYLYISDLSGNIQPLSIRFPSHFSGGSLSQPVTFLTAYKDFCLVSVNYDQYVYKIAVGNMNVSKTKFSFNSEVLPKSDSENKSERLQAWTKRNNYSPTFGAAFWSPNDSFIYRFYYPDIPDYKVNGSYLSYANRKIEILSESGDRKYSLPTKRYFLKDKWWFFDDKLYYLKWGETSAKEAYYFMDKINLNEY
jgi:hypothetical protein